MGNVANDVRKSLTGPEGFYEETRLSGAPTGPWPAIGEAEHVFQGVEARASKFGWYVNNQRQTVPGVAIQLTYETIPADSDEPVTWRGSLLVIPADFQAIFPQLPEGKKLQIEIGMGRIRAALGFILERESINLLGDIDAANAMVEEDVDVILTVRVADDKYPNKNKPGEFIEQFIDYVNGAVVSRPANTV